MTKNYIETRKLSVELGGKTIIREVDFNAKEKQFIGIIGPNGSGKSTLLKSIYRVLKPSSGAIYLTGASLTEMSYKDSAKKQAVVSQHNYYNFDFKVFDVVLMGRAPHKKQLERDNALDYEKVKYALSCVDMLESKDRSFSTLSGGEQQRIILARAIAQDTKCLILDEPTNHLDIKHQLDILSLVKNLNITLVAAFHDLNIASMYCDQIVVLKDGLIVNKGTPSEVLTRETIKEIYGVESSILEDPIDKSKVITFRRLK